MDLSHEIPFIAHCKSDSASGIVEGATVYLPVNVPGALLYVGDGHAAQGDGELNGYALESSMDIELPRGNIPKPLHLACPGGRSRAPARRTEDQAAALGRLETVSYQRFSAA
jgi:acetamidase/formamidase